jgi:hypothetical protein
MQLGCYGNVILMLGFPEPRGTEKSIILAVGKKTAKGDSTIEKNARWTLKLAT